MSIASLLTWATGVTRRWDSDNKVRQTFRATVSGLCTTESDLVSWFPFLLWEKSLVHIKTKKDSDTNFFFYNLTSDDLMMIEYTYTALGSVIKFDSQNSGKLEFKHMKALLFDLLMCGCIFSAIRPIYLLLANIMWKSSGNKILPTSTTTFLLWYLLEMDRR